MDEGGEGLFAEGEEQLVFMRFSCASCFDVFVMT